MVEVTVRKWGKSLGVVIPNLLAERNHIEDGDVIDIEITKIKDLISVICPRCQTLIEIDEDTDPIDCPVCGLEAYRVHFNTINDLRNV